MSVRKIRVMHGRSTEYKANAKKLAKALEAEFGEVADVVVRPNREDATTDAIREQLYIALVHKRQSLRFRFGAAPTPKQLPPPAGAAAHIYFRRHCNLSSIFLRAGVGIEYFSDAVQMQDQTVWIGTPPSAEEQKGLKKAAQAAPGQTSDGTDYWMAPAVDAVGALLSELLEEDEYEAGQSQKLEDGDSFVLTVSIAVAVGAAFFAIAPHVYHFS